METKSQTQAPGQEVDSIAGIAKSNRRWLIFVLAMIIGVALVGLAGFLLYNETDRLYVGQVEMTEVRVSGKVPGRITRFLVNEGDFVHKGDTLVEIYSPEVLAKEQQAEAGDQLAIALQKGVLSRSSSELKQMALSAWTAAQAALEVGQKGFERAERLYKEGVISAQKYDEAEAKLRSLQAAEEITRNQYNLAKRGVLGNDKEAAKALVDKSKGVMSEVNAYLQEGMLLAPIDGLVADIFPHEGELVGTGAPIMNIADSQKARILWAVPEDELPLFPKGAIVTGRVPALGHVEIELRITKHRDLGIYAVKKATKSNRGVDVRSFEVAAVPNAPLEGLEAGMSIILEQPKP